MAASSPAQYLVDLETIIRCLSKKGGELTKYLKNKKKTRLKEQILVYQDDPGAKLKLMDLYQRAKQRQFERFQEHQRKKIETLDDEKAISTARLFLTRYAQGGQTEEATIPGFPGFGQEAGRELLSDIAKVALSERPGETVDE